MKVINANRTQPYVILCRAAGELASTVRLVIFDGR